MEDTIQCEPLGDTLPPFWHEDFFKLALECLDTSEMSDLDIALYENALLRARTVAQFNDKKLKKAVAKAVKKATKETIERITKEIAAENIVKKLLLRGKATIEEIAEYIDVSIDFVKKVQDALDKEKEQP